MFESEKIVEGNDAPASDKIDTANRVSKLVDDIFDSGNESKSEAEKPENKQKKQKESVKEIKKVQETDINEKKSEPKDKDIEEKPVAKEKKSIEQDDEDETDSRQAELEKLKKALNDSQKWGHTNNRRLKKVAKLVESLKESEVLNDEEFNQINELLSLDPEEEERVENSIRSPIGRLTQKANKRLGDLREIYEDDKSFDKKIAAFDHYYDELSKDEQEDLLEELEKIENSEFKLAKRMYQLGEKYYESEYKEIEEAGGYKQLLANKNSELEKLQKKIDKLSNKLLQYEDYDNPTYKVEESGSTSNLVKRNGYNDFVEEIFAK